MLAVVLLVAALLISCRVETNYEDPNEPRFEGTYSDLSPDDAPEPGDAIKVVTWNIAFAKEVGEAIEELSEIEELQGADIILLQEMDEEGTEAIAKALKYDYVYYPASIHSRHERNFGNAVLSKWPIVDSEKLILPHQNPANDQIRIAVRAIVDLNGLEMPVYSVHTETFWLGQEGRYDQFQFLAEEVDPDNDYVIVQRLDKELSR